MDPDESPLEKLINQCKSNDVDVKIDALTKLQAEVESGTEITDSEALIGVLKTCLRTSNQHLVAATLTALPPVLTRLLTRQIRFSNSQNILNASASSSTSSSAPTSMIDTVTLRQVLAAFLPAGGLMERLGDKERVQAKAREALVILGGMAFRSGASSTLSTGSRGGKGPETPLAMYERFLRESGFASKVWKVREQTILALVHLRREHHTFPIRPYLPALVDSLEDTDAHVRDCARTSVIELFSGPAVTDAARADLKKELIKKNVRKTIVDGVLSKLLGTGSTPASREGSENGDAPAKSKEYVPPSMALKVQKPAAGRTRTISQQDSARETPRPASRVGTSTPAPTPASDSAEVEPVYIASARDLENEFADMAKHFEGKETEHNWLARNKAIVRVRGMLKGDIHRRYADVFMGCLKDGFMQWSLKTLASLRTTVATDTCSLYCELATALGHSLDPFTEPLLSYLLKMAGFTKKITAQQSQACVTALIIHTSGTPRIFIPLLWQTLQEKTVQARVYVVAHIKLYLEIHGHRLKHSIESTGSVDILDKCMKKALADPNPGVREKARICFWVFEDIWRDRGLVILESLDGTARKQLEKACPNPDAVAFIPPVTPKPTKKSSVAAAIAASRAKAKAIATSPPSLRHQATSASHMPSVKRSSSPSPTRSSPRNSNSVSTTARPSSPLRMSTSPPQRPRVASNGVQPRSVSTSVISSSRPLPISGAGHRPSPPSSPSDPHHSYHRRTSSPLSTGSPSTIRRAVQTALPSSPESPTPRNAPKQVLSKVLFPAGSAGGRNSSLLPEDRGDEDSLLLATAIPIPEDDSDLEGSMNLMSFSSVMEQQMTMFASLSSSAQVPMNTPLTPKSNSQVRSLSPKSVDSRTMPLVSNALSSDSIADLASTGGQLIVEDALRARAEQAESAAERLLELVEPEEEGVHHPSLPLSLLVGSNNAPTNGNGSSMTSKPKSKPNPLPIPATNTLLPSTPVNRSTAIMRQAALFKDSPVYNGRSASLVDVLQDHKHETGWWLKRKTLIAQRLPTKNSDASATAEELQHLIATLAGESAGIEVLQKLIFTCRSNPSVEPSSPISPDFGYPASPSPFSASASVPSLPSDIWERNKNFEKLLTALFQFLDPSKGEEEIEYGLILLWEMLENQAVHLESREAEIFSLLLRIRYCNKINVLEATSTIRDALTAKIDPIYGLTTLHASLRAFDAEPAPPSCADDQVKAATYAFGLMALGKFILRLPAEIAEEEIPRLKGTLIASLNDKLSLVVRESAASAIIAAQLVLRDETHLFALLDGLADDKKNLLTYLFDKHGARGSISGKTGMDKLEKEMRRLDTRLSTPPRPSTTKAL